MMLLTQLMAAGALFAASPAPRVAHAAPHGAVARPQPDSAETMLRAGNDALARGDNKRAAEIFQRLAERYPKTSYANDAMYFQALALYRVGEPDDLRKARVALDPLREAESRTLRSDALSLDTRICGELAKRGDERCARTVTSRAQNSDLAVAVSDVVRATAAATADVLQGQAVQNAIASAGNAARAGIDAGVRASAMAMQSAAISLGSLNGIGSARTSSECDRDDDNDIALIALNAVQQMDADRAVPLLKKVMARRDKCSENLRRTAVMLLARKKVPESADLLIDAARNDPDAETRQQAVFWLSRIDGDRAATFLREVATKPGDTEVRKQALYALSQSSAPGARETLRQVASSNDSDLEVRSQAIFWLGNRGTPEDMDYLRSLYSKVESRKLKDQILGSIARRKGNSEWLLGIALDPKETMDLRKQALFWAGQSGAPIDQMVALYDKSNDHEMKDALINVFRQRSSASGPAFEKLLDIARTEKDTELRKNALFWVASSKDPRAQKLLEDIIERKP